MKRILAIFTACCGLAFGVSSVSVPAAQASTLSPASGWNCGSGGTASITDYYGSIGELYAQDYLFPSPGDSFCWVASSISGWQYFKDTSYVNLCLTWNKPDKDFDEMSCGGYPAAQSMKWVSTSTGTEIMNDQAGECIGGETQDEPLYEYKCLPNGARSLDWVALF